MSRREIKLTYERMGHVREMLARCLHTGTTEFLLRIYETGCYTSDDRSRLNIIVEKFNKEND